VFITYASALRNGFVWDYIALILRDPLIRSWRLIPEGFNHFLFLDATASDFYRPVQRLTYKLNSTTTGTAGQSGCYGATATSPSPNVNPPAEGSSPNATAAASASPTASPSATASATASAKATHRTNGKESTTGRPKSRRDRSRRVIMATKKWADKKVNGLRQKR
jgi:hypothetical protein